MSHYNFELDLYSDNANADIIQRVKPGSDVLEFGPAFGRMTCYLHEHMKCTVDIVELDQESGNIAAQYAHQACLGAEEGNIESGFWMNAFSDRRYDAIIFTDVLEHLHDPQHILNDCRSFLKEEGVVLCSVPNIAHSSVILGLLDGKFQYTDNGLLDRTHIHFFTEESFCKMISNCGYYITYEHAIVMPVGSIEIPFTYDAVGKDVENALRRRPNNEAYQFIFELRKKVPGRIEESIIITEPSQASKCICYIKDENESSFSEQKKICQAVTFGKNDISFSLRNFPHARAVRVVLLNSNSVLRLEKITAVTDKAEVELVQYDTPGFRTEDHLLCFFENCAELYLWLPEGKKYNTIRLQYNVLIYNSDILSIMGKELCTGLFHAKQQLENTVTQLASEKSQLEKSIEKIQAEENDHSITLTETLSVNEILKNQLKEQAEEKKTFQEEISLISEQNTKLQEILSLLRKQNETYSSNIDELKQQLNSISHLKSQLDSQYELVTQHRDSLLKQNEEQKQQLDIILQDKLKLSQQVASLTANLAIVSNEVTKMEKSLSWKITFPFRLMRHGLEKCQNVISAFITLGKNTAFFYKHYGLKASINRAIHFKKIKEWEALKQMEIRQESEKADLWENLNNWIDSTPHDFIDIFPVPMGWNTPLFQRFQHLSLQAGKAGGISFYGAHPAVDNDVTVYKFVTPSLCIVNLDNPDVTAKFWKVLDQKAGLKFLRVQSIDLATDIAGIESFLKRGYQIVYEYIDELTPQITGNIPEFVYKRHEYMLRNEDITVVATSDKLFDQVKPYREHNMLMLNNGVDYEHWHLDRKEISCPEDIKEIVAQGKIIIGYHGALAQWIDYELLNRIAEDDRYILLLIGYEHDGNLKKSRVLEKPNVYYLGPRNYQDLNHYAIFYDIAILPFILNNITLSVSPVKIFEYMAAGKPVVTYALPECRKYQSCLCAETQDEFMMQLEKAAALRYNQDYLETLRKDALDNTWESITRKMVEYVKLGYAKALSRRSESSLLDPLLDSAYKDLCMEEVLRFPKYYDAQEYRPITEMPYLRKENDCKIIAYYLTQFHPDPHNEDWWGKGVTEWNNVSRAVPQFQGHYQPHLPGELGFYDLRIIENMKRQIELAQQYGIYGFSFYYYWFDGDRLLEQPLEMFLANPELNFPFSLCWANENWTRRFDGTNQDILMEQPNSVESYKNVIHDMGRFLSDTRYIEISGKKMITIYRPSLMPQVKMVLNYWREYCLAEGIGEIYLIAVKENMIDIDWLKEGYDAVSEFHPGTLYTNCLKINSELKFLRKDFCGEVFSYPDIVHKQKYFRYDLPKLYRAVMPMWDNTARRDNKGMIFQGSTPTLYKRWLKDVIQAGEQRNDLDDNIIFINAWNEWGEGAYLEPDKRYGYAYLEATKEAVEECRKNKGINEEI